MADNVVNNTEQPTEPIKKFFLDFGGLKTLWSKINSTFTSKTEFEQNNEQLTANINKIGGDLKDFSNASNLRMDGIEDTMGTFMPREYKNYTNAVNGCAELAPGAVIKIKEDSPLLDEKNEPVKGENGEVAIYRAGLYVVLDPKNKVIEKLSTASGSGTEANIEDVADAVDELMSSYVKAAIVTDENGNQLSSIQKENNTLIFKVDNEFKVNSESVNMLTHKAVAAMFGTLSAQITQIPKFKIAVVDELPKSEISLTTIYLVKNSDEYDNNLYTEYIYVEKTKDDPETKDVNESKYVWEKLGEQSLVIDDFAKKRDVEVMIAAAMQEVVKKEDLTTAIDTAKGEILTAVEKQYISKEDAEKYIDQKELEEALDLYYTKEESDSQFLTKAIADSLYVKEADIDDFMTETEIIASMQTGTIGNVIRISDDMISSIINTTE